MSERQPDGVEESTNVESRLAVLESSVEELREFLNILVNERQESPAQINPLAEDPQEQPESSARRLTKEQLGRLIYQFSQIYQHGPTGKANEWIAGQVEHTLSILDLEAPQ